MLVERKTIPPVVGVPEFGRTPPTRQTGHDMWAPLAMSPLEKLTPLPLLIAMPLRSVL